MLCYLLANLIPVSGFDGILRFWLSPNFLPHFTFIVDEVWSRRLKGRPGQGSVGVSAG